MNEAFWLGVCIGSVVSLFMIHGIVVLYCYASTRNKR